jgi:hypothetical protein
MRASPWLAALVVAMTAGPTWAQPKPARPAPPKIVKDPPPPPLVGLTALGGLRPAAGFIDDPIAVSGPHLLAIVRAGADVKIARLNLADGALASELAIGAVTPEPHHVVPVGDRLLVVHGVGDLHDAVVLDATGKPGRSWKAARDFAVRTINGKPAVIAVTTTARGKATVHDVTLYDLGTGKKLKKKGGALTIGPDGLDAKLDFRPVYFQDDGTVAVGVRGGVWRKRENQRSPDSWAAYDLVTGAWRTDEPITDLIGLARRQPILAAHDGERVFARMLDDLSAVEAWRDGKATELTLDQPLDVYDPTSLQYSLRGDSLWLSLTVDPTNPPAVRRQKADPRYLDLFEVTGDRAVRRARLLLGKTGVRWGWAGDTWWVLEKGAGIGRGGPAINLYKL